jgi:hypothetical protein
MLLPSVQPVLARHCYFLFGIKFSFFICLTYKVSQNPFFGKVFIEINKYYV